MGIKPSQTLQRSLISLTFLFACFISTSAFAKSKSAYVASNNMDFSRMETGQYTVEILLNGEGPFVFMIDSAATRTSIFEKTLSKLGIEDQLNGEALISGMTETRLRPRVDLESITFGKALFKDHTVVVLEDWEELEEPLDGIIGIELLQKFSLDFSHGENRLRVRKRFNPRAIKYKGWNKIQLIPNPYPVEDYGLKFTGAKIGKSLIPAMFDTGANFSTISWNSVEGTRLEKEKKRLREEWVVQGAIGEFKPRMVVKLPQRRTFFSSLKW